MSKNYTAVLSEIGHDTDGTERHTYRVFDSKGGLIGCAEVLPTGITGLDESIIADLMEVPDGVAVTIEARWPVPQPRRGGAVDRGAPVIH